MNIILAIPGPWMDALELARMVEQTGDGVTLHDGLLSGAGASGQVVMAEYDVELTKSFEQLNRQTLSLADIDLIAGHRSCAYLIFPGGSTATASQCMLAGAAILHAGGFAVKVESSGAVHSAASWLAQAARCETHVGALYIGFVALNSRQQQVYSCGMHLFGLPDAITQLTTSPLSAGELLRGFLMSMLHEQPSLFSEVSTLDDGAGHRYLLTLEVCTFFEPDDPYYNPHGLWRLNPITA